MSQNRDYATHDHAIRYALHEHAEATLALRAAGCPHTEASQVAYRAAGDELLPKLAKQHGVNLARLEKTALDELNRKAKEKTTKQKTAAKAKQKLQTSAKTKKPTVKKKKATKA